MKNHVSFVLLGLAAATATANASELLDFAPKGYIGAEYKYLSDIHGLDPVEEISQEAGVPGSFFVEDYTNMLGLVAGVQINDYLGVELSHAMSLKDLSNLDGLSFDLNTTNLSVTGQYPISDRYYAKAAIGRTWIRLEAEAMGEKDHITQDEFMGKIGVGYQWNDKSVSELTYQNEGGLDGFAFQYKYLF